MEELKLHPPRAGAPAVSNWGVFGDDDEVGTLNFLTSEAVLRGAATIREGRTFPLNLPVNLPTDRPIGRPEHAKTAHLRNLEFGGIVVNDDHLLLATQGSSQWDSFVHCGASEDGIQGIFYNGVGLDAVDEDGYARRNGIDMVARRGITGRGVLLDIARMICSGSEEALSDDYMITDADVDACLRHQGTEIIEGDVLCFRTGWTESYLDADQERRAQMMTPVGMTGAPPSPGISADLAPRAQSERWSAVTADNLAVEVSPFRPDNVRSAHVRMQRNLGLPFGELLCFRDLAAAAASDNRWEFFFVAVPLWIPGGMGSPANAMAIR